MIKIEIPDEAFWAAIGFCILLTAGSVIRFVKWQGEVLTKDKHDEICSKNHAAAKESYDKVLKKLDAQDVTMATNHTQNTGTMTQLAGDIGVLKTDVAVLKTKEESRG